MPSETSDWGDDGLVSGVCCVSWKNLAAWGLFFPSPGAAAYSIELADGWMMDALGAVGGGCEPGSRGVNGQLEAWEKAGFSAVHPMM